jgi:AcrR family transcriptional regulator
MPRRQPVARTAVPADPDRLPTKQRIEQAALQLFAAKGFEATGIREIADRAGLSTSALYHYMGSKDELLVAFMVESMTELTRVTAAALAEAELRAVSDAAFTKVMQLRDGYERMWAETLEGGRRSGEFSFGNARLTRLALLEMCNGVARWYSDRGPMHPAEIADSFADLALAMVGARRDGVPVRTADLPGRPTGEILALVEAELRTAS